MRHETIDGITVLYAEEGLTLYVLEDGTEVGETAYLGVNDTPENYGERAHEEVDMSAE